MKKLSLAACLLSVLALAACGEEAATTDSSSTDAGYATVESVCEQLVALQCAGDPGTAAECVEELNAAKTQLDTSCPGVFQELLDCSNGKFVCGGDDNSAQPEAACLSTFEGKLQTCASAASGGGSGSDSSGGSGSGSGGGDQTCADKCFEDNASAFEELAGNMFGNCACSAGAPCETDCAPQCNNDSTASPDACNACIDDKVGNQNECATKSFDACAASATCKPLLDCLSACN